MVNIAVKNENTMVTECMHQTTIKNWLSKTTMYITCYEKIDHSQIVLNWHYQYGSRIS